MGATPIGPDALKPDDDTLRLDAGESEAVLAADDDVPVSPAAFLALASLIRFARLITAVVWFWKNKSLWSG